MNVTQMISELRAERSSIEDAIVVLERLVRAQPGRRGRPPKWLASAKASAVNHVSTNGSGTKRVFSAATRKKMALAQKKRWAALKGQPE
jgi:hypothetical protein